MFTAHRLLRTLYYRNRASQPPILPSFGALPAPKSHSPPHTLRLCFIRSQPYLAHCCKPPSSPPRLQTATQLCLCARVSAESLARSGFDTYCILLQVISFTCRNCVERQQDQLEKTQSRCSPIIQGAPSKKSTVSPHDLDKATTSATLTAENEWRLMTNLASPTTTSARSHRPNTNT